MLDALMPLIAPSRSAVPVARTSGTILASVSGTSRRMSLEALPYSASWSGTTWLSNTSIEPSAIGATSFSVAVTSPSQPTASAQSAPGGVFAPSARSRLTPSR
jgi:hypothetical protein